MHRHFFRGSSSICVVFSIFFAAILGGCGSDGAAGGDMAPEGATKTVSWTAVPDPSVLGYKIYWGTMSHQYESRADVGPNTSYAVSGLRHGTTYFFAVSAYNTGGESGLSNEVSTLVE
jgi:Fibronectin type III domain